MRVVVIAIMAIGLAGAAEARNSPCSGKKGGISHCQGKIFICKNGTTSQSKRSCSR